MDVASPDCVTGSFSWSVTGSMNLGCQAAKGAEPDGGMVLAGMPFAEAGQPSLAASGSSSIMGRDVSVAWCAEHMLLMPRGAEGPPSSPSLLT